MIEHIVTLNYARSSLIFGTPLGNGTDGKVWQSNRNTAVKAFDREVGYWNERDSYLRFQEYGVTSIEGHTVPQIVGYDEVDPKNWAR